MRISLSGVFVHTPPSIMADSSAEGAGLVAYSSSSDDGDGVKCEGVRGVKRRRTASQEPLPLPPALLSLYQDQEHSDSGCHGGRVRSFPHVRGQWATHVLIPFELPWRLASCVDSLQQFLKTTSVLGDSFDSVTLHQFPFQDLHVSLSRTVPIPFHVIDPLTQSLRERFCLHSRFPMSLSNLSWYCNEDSTRSFLGWDVSKGHDKLVSLVKDTDHCFSRFKLQPFYEDPAFHASLLWCLGDLGHHITPSQLHQTQVFWEDALSSQGQNKTQQLSVSEIICRSGNKDFSFSLQSPS